MEINISRRKEIEDIRKEIKTAKGDKLEELKKIERAYEESGEIYYNEEEIKNVSLKKFRTIFTNKRLDLLKKINENHFNSIAEISRYLKRDIKNVYQDLKILESFRLIKLEKTGKKIKPKNLVESINIKFFGD